MNEYPAKLNTGYYRVRTDWNDDASQLGAYKLLANAKAKCDENPGPAMMHPAVPKRTSRPQSPSRTPLLSAS